MKAAVFRGPRDVRIENVPDPTIGAPTDALVRITRTAICGSDLHFYHGRLEGVAVPFVIGHEAVGVVEDVGSAVRQLKRGQRVVISAVAACGECFYCRRGQVSQCEETGSAVFGCGAVSAGKLGSIGGAQAEFITVPFADYTAYPLPEAIGDDAAVFLADILPTGYFGALNGGIKPGDTVAIIGCGPVGLCAIMSAGLFGPAQILAVDNIDYRLALAARTGATPIKASQVVEEVLQRTDGRGVDVVIEAVGNESALGTAFAVVRPGGTVSAVGVFTEQSYEFPIGLAFMRDLTFKIGLADIRTHIPALAKLVQSGRLNPEPLISHRLSLNETPRGYELFDAHADNSVKVLLKP